jgi:hypothetical protein
MGSIAQNAALFQHHDMIGVHDGTYALGNNNGSGAFKIFLEAFAKFRIRTVIQGT